MSRVLKIGLVGLGKIARDQHLPAIANIQGAELVAVASRNATADGVPNYADLEVMLAGQTNIDAVILCQPPQVRYEAARLALASGKHVFLEKPPATTVTEAEALVELADRHQVTLFASWHSRFAAAVDAARQWLLGKTLRRASIVWKEDVRHWHPGQAWIWEPGGFGVFDPGINALSILTEIVAEPILLTAAELEVPSNRQAPIAADLTMRTTTGAPIDAVFDWRQTGPQNWYIAVETDQGRMLLSHGGSRFFVDGVEQTVRADDEYPAMYRRFIDLVAEARSDADMRPLRLVADAFLCGRHRSTEAFDD